MDERVLRRQCARCRLRQRDGRSGRDRPTAVLNEPRSPAAELFVEDQRASGADGRDPRGQRDQRGARIVLRRPDRADLVAGEFRCAVCFSLLHVSVVWYYIGRKKSKNYLLHLVVPTAGFAIIVYVLYNADYLAKVGGLVWLAIGAVVFIVNKLRGRGVPELSEERAVPGEGINPQPATAASSDRLGPPR
jgi:hypothetical protein